MIELAVMTAITANRSLRTLILLVSFLSTVTFCVGQTDTTKKTSDTLRLEPDGTEGILNAIRAEDSNAKKLPPNEFTGSISTFKIGLGYIHDFVTYIQSDEFKQQRDSGKFDVYPRGKLRDFRVLGSGVLKTKRYISWKFAYMWDGDGDQWLVRETGITFGVPELWGNIFVGRTKEGYSLIKVMNGHSPWGMERQMLLDVIPILADGIKWMAYLPKSRVFWNLGAFNDILSKGQGFSTFEWQYVLRVGWLPILDEKNNKMMHIAANLRYAKPLDEKITLKSRPESNPTPQLINTGSFSAEKASNLGYEIYYRNKSFMIGSEGGLHNFYSGNGDHQFWGANIDISYFFTKAVRPYIATSSIFGFMPIKRSVFKKGIGEIEGMLRFSVMDLNHGNIKGGRMWRITPMVNWYLSRNLRWEFVYGYGVLDRFGIKGVVQFFESRIQVSLL